MMNTRPEKMDEDFEFLDWSYEFFIIFMHLEIMSFLKIIFETDFWKFDHVQKYYEKLWQLDSVSI